MKVCIRLVRNEFGGYTAKCPTLPGCVSTGETREEAQQRLDEAIRGYIAAVNNFVPERLDHEVLEV
ncbi:MAG: type II toxin-antitoxin system HicB family antitoxin [Phycisphaerae bacterium]